MKIGSAKSKLAWISFSCCQARKETIWCFDNFLPDSQFEPRALPVVNFETDSYLMLPEELNSLDARAPLTYLWPFKVDISQRKSMIPTTVVPDFFQ